MPENNSSTTDSDNGNTANIPKSTKESNELKEQKEVAFYGAAVNAWVTTSMELDKSLLTLASGAIAFSITLISPLKGSELMMFFYFLANILFLVTVFSTLGAFRLNKGHIESLIQNRNDGSNLLPILDKAASWSFSLGIALIFIVGSVSIVKNIESKDKEVTDKKEVLQELNKSLHGLKDAVPCLESLQNFAALRNSGPQAAAAQPTAMHSTSQSQTSTPTSQQNAPTPGTLGALKP